MKIVAGLGNPGKRYANTPHNAGFAVVDALAGRLGGRFRKSWRFKARMASVSLSGRDLVLVKPDTYMNRSGLAVASILRARKEGPESLIVILDDADLGLGRLRIRPGGGSGGHRGLDSVIRDVQSNEFVRVRVGIGRGLEDKELIAHVLAPVRGEARDCMDGAVAAAADAVLCVIESGVGAAMNAYNGRGC